MDWGAPGAIERDFSLTDYIAGRLDRASFSWGAFEDVGSVGPVVVLWLEPGAGVFIPRRAFSSPDAQRTFVDFAAAQIASQRRAAA